MYNEFGKKIQDLRKKKNMTQEELASRLGVTAQAVSKWENDLSFPDITLMPNIAIVLNTDINYFFNIEKGIEEKHSFPQTYQNMNLVHCYRNTACYSSKTVASIQDSGVIFTDGSTAELSTNLAVNKGFGEIKFILGTDNENKKDYSEMTKKFTFDCLSSLLVELYSNYCIIETTNDEKCHVVISGEAWFVKSCSIFAEDGKLNVRYLNIEENNNRQYNSANKVKITVPYKNGKELAINIKGSGKLESQVDCFETSKISINGSGTARIQNSQQLNVSINGSGVVNCQKCENGRLVINGSGDINLTESQNLLASINGSGDIDVTNVKIVSASINGSGDLSIDELTGGDATFKICGSGDIKIKKGNCHKFDALISGSGDINATDITAVKASIIIESDGKVILGRVIDSSTEQIKRKGLIKILHRGPISKNE